MRTLINQKHSPFFIKPKLNKFAKEFTQKVKPELL